MARVSYKEQMFYFTGAALCELDNSNGFFADSLEEFSQVFNLSTSILLIRVRGNTLQLHQVHLSSFSHGPYEPYQWKSIQEGCRVKIDVDGPIVRDVCLTCDENVFMIVFATSRGKIYKYSFSLNTPFVEGRGSFFLGTGGYSLGSVNPTCFSLLKTGSVDDVCVGLPNGNILMATLPYPDLDTFLLPVAVVELAPGNNLVSAISNLIKKKTNAPVLRIGRVQHEADDLIVLSEDGILRLYSSLAKKFTCHYDLKTKPSAFVLWSNFVAVGHEKTVSILKIEEGKLELIQRLEGKEPVVSIDANPKGLWVVWRRLGAEKIVCYKNNGETFNVLCWFSEFQKEHFEDTASPLDKLLVPGRLPKQVIEQAVSQCLGRSSFSFQTNDLAAELRSLGNDSFLQNVIGLSEEIVLKSSGITAICCPSNFYPVTFRSDTSNGFIRKLTLQIEISSLELSHKISKIYRHPNNAKLTNNYFYMKKAMADIRIWRNKRVNLREKPFSDALTLIMKEPISHEMMMKIKRSQSKRLVESIMEEVKEFDELMCPRVSHDNKIEEWPPFMPVFIGGACFSLIRNLTEYSLDLLIFILISSFRCRAEIHKSLIGKMWDYTASLAALYRKISEPVFHVSLVPYEFPANCCSLFNFEKGNVILGQFEYFCGKKLKKYTHKVLKKCFQSLISLPSVSSFNASELYKVVGEDSLDLLVSPAMNFQYGINTEDPMAAFQYFVRVFGKTESPNLENDKVEFAEGPWNLNQEERMALGENDMSLVYEESLNRSLLNVSTKKKVLMSSYMIHSVKMKYNEKYFENMFCKMALIGQYDEACKVIGNIRSDGAKRNCLVTMLDHAKSTNNFFSVLSINLSVEMKEKILNILSDKSCEDADLGSIGGTESHMNWHSALYAFCMQFSYYEIAAESMYRLYYISHKFAEVEESCSRISELALSLAFNAACLSNMRHFLVRLSNYTSPNRRLVDDTQSNTSRYTQIVVSLTDIRKKIL